MSKNQRPIDIMAKRHYSWWGRSFVFIKKNEIKTWQAIFIIAFISGIATTLVWTISNSIHPFSSAEEIATSTPAYYSLRVSRANDYIGGKVKITSKSFNDAAYTAGVSNYYANDVVTLSATPSAGYIFSGWSGNCDKVNGTTCIVKMNGNKIVTINFGKPTFSLRVSRGNSYIGGTVKITSNSYNTTGYTAGVSNYYANDVVTLSATPSAGYIFSGWSGNCDTINGVTCIVKMNGNKIVTTNFVVTTNSRRR